MSIESEVVAIAGVSITLKMNLTVEQVESELESVEYAADEEPSSEILRELLKVLRNAEDAL